MRRVFSSNLLRGLGGMTGSRRISACTLAVSILWAGAAQAAVPNDPYFTLQYFLRNTGQSGGTAGEDVDVISVWDNTTGSSSVVVAIIDTGSDTNHMDLAGNVWANASEIPNNSIDDDSNGFVDDVVGWDFVDNDNTPQDDDGHGTHVAGLVGGVSNNSNGIASINWDVSVMILKVVGASATDTTDVIDAINYAAANGADLICMAIDNLPNDAGIKSAIESSGLLVVTQAGNSTQDIDSSPLYPGSWDSPNILNVMAVDRNAAASSFSNYGANTVDIAAPGISVLSITPGNTYSFYSGTSQAAGITAGGAALILSVKPTLSATKLKKLLIASAEDKAGLSDKCVSGGTLNLANAYLAANSTASGVILSNNSGNFTVTGNTSIGDVGGEGVAIEGASGTVNLGGGSITNPGDTAFRVGSGVDASGGNGDITYSGTITDDDARAVEIRERTGGTVDLNGLVSSSGTDGLLVTGNDSGTPAIRFDGGVSLTSTTTTAVDMQTNTGASISFADLDIDNASGNSRGILANNIGTLTIIDGTVSTVNNIAVDISNASLAVALESVSASNAAKGLALNTVDGSFDVSGAGTTDGSGGTIQTITQRGIELINASNISLKNMTLTNANTVNGAVSDGFTGGNENTDENGAIHLASVTNVDLENVDINGAAQHGINGNDVTDLDLTGCTIQNIGDAQYESGIYLFHLKGTQSDSAANIFDGVTIASTAQFNLYIRNSSGTNAPGGAMDRLEMVNCIFQSNAASFAGEQALIGNEGTANFQAVITNGTFTSAGAGQTDTSLFVSAEGTSHSDLSVGNTTFSNGTVALGVVGAGTSVSTFNIAANSGISAQADGVRTSAQDDASLSGTISGNTITTPDVNNIGYGIYSNVDGTGDATILMDGNTVNNYATGIRARATSDTTAVANYSITNNNITINATTGFNAVRVDSGPASVGANALCLNISGNTTSASLGFDYDLRQYIGNSFALQGFSGDGTNAAIVEAYVAGSNVGTPIVNTGGDVTDYTASTCTTP